jgi:hypothetical protein
VVFVVPTLQNYNFWHVDFFLDNSMKKALVCLISGLLIFLLLPLASTYGNQETIAISGKLVNGTMNADIPENVSVTLRVFEGDSEMDAIPPIFAINGQFGFENIPVGEAYQYIFTATYSGVEYREQFVASANLSDVQITLYEATDSLENISIVINTLIVMGAQLPERKLSIMEILRVVNSGDRTFLPDMDNLRGMNFLRFPLPSGALDLEIQSDFLDGKAIQVDKGLGLIASIPPGNHGVVLNYAAPYTGNNLDISRSFSRGVGSFRVLIPQDLADIVSSRIVGLEETIIGKKTFQLLESNDIGSGESVDVILNNLPQPSIAQLVSMGIQSGLVKTLVVPVTLSIALGFLLLLGYRRVALPGLDFGYNTGTKRTSLVGAVAFLDDQFERGGIDEIAYKKKRVQLKTQLLRETQLGEQRR